VRRWQVRAGNYKPQERAYHEQSEPAHSEPREELLYLQLLAKHLKKRLRIG